MKEEMLRKYCPEHLAVKRMIEIKETIGDVTKEVHHRHLIKTYKRAIKQLEK